MRVLVEIELSEGEVRFLQHRVDQSHGEYADACHYYLARVRDAFEYDNLGGEVLSVRVAPALGATHES